MNVLAFVACLAMISSPVLHSQIMSNSDGDWTWLCTGKGFSHINFDADNNEEEAEHNLSGTSSCCLYDVAPKPEVISFKYPEHIAQVTELSFYQFTHIHLFSHYSSRAPPYFS